MYFVNFLGCVSKIWKRIWIGNSSLLGMIVSVLTGLRALSRDRSRPPPHKSPPQTFRLRFQIEMGKVNGEFPSE